jgi:hypothetical protein
MTPLSSAGITNEWNIPSLPTHPETIWKMLSLKIYNRVPTVCHASVAVYRTYV